MKNSNVSIMHQWLLVLVCWVCALPTWADDYTKDGIIYSLDDTNNTASVKGVTDKSITTASIVKRAGGYKVTSIGSMAFYY